MFKLKQLGNQMEQIKSRNLLLWKKLLRKLQKKLTSKEWH